MPRYLITDPFPLAPSSISEDALVIAPDARSFCEISVPVMSLYQVAKECLKAKGFGISSPIKSAQALRSAVHRVLPRVDSGAVSRHYRETIAAILRSGIDSARLASVGSESARNAALISIEYTEVLKRARLIDRDAVFVEAVRQRAIDARKVLIYGYFRARQLPARSEEIEFIDKLAGEGSVYFLPYGEEPIFAANRTWFELLTARGWQVSSPQQTKKGETSGKLAVSFANGKIVKGEQSSEDFKAYEYSGLETEVRGMLARAKAAALNGTNIDRVVIACRDIRAYVRALLAVGREYGLPLDFAHQIPIAETALGEFIALIFEALDTGGDREAEPEFQIDESRFAYEPTLRLLMHRLGPGLSDVERFEAHRRLPSGLDRWKEISIETEFLHVPGKRSCGEWTKWLAGLLARWDVTGAGKLGAYAAEIEAHKRLFESLELVAFENGDEPVEISRYAADVSDILLNVSTPVHTEKGGIKVRQPNEIVGREYDAMFVIGMAEGMLPALSADSNVIDLFECDELREHDIHFQNALEVPRWEAITFYFMLHACRGPVTFSYPRFAGDSERLESSYFRRMGLTPRKPDDAFISSMPEFRQSLLLSLDNSSEDEVLPFARHQYSVEQHRESGGRPDEYDGVIGTRVVRNSWSASSLGKIGSCPFKWFASDLLRLRSPEESDTDLPATTRGTLLHKTLELAVGRSKDAKDLRAAVVKALESAFEEAEATDESLTLITNWRLRRTEQLDKLRIALASEHFLIEGAAVIEVEKPFEAEFCGLTIKGTIDRIDQLSDGSMLALDYKHGSYLTKVKDENGFLTVEIQLPLYSMVALPELYPGRKTTGRFFHLADPKKTEVENVDLTKFISQIKTMLDTGNFAVDPDQQRKACKYCDYDVVCRVGPRLSRRSEGR